MSIIKTLIKRYFTSFTYFYRYLRYKIFIAVGQSILVSVLDGFGIAMFLPLLQMVGDSTVVDPEGMGNLRFLVDGLQQLGIRLTLASVLLFMLIFFVLKGIFTFISGAYQVVLKQFFIRQLRLNMLNALNRMKFKTFVTSDAGRIQNTMSGEVDRVAQGFSHYFQALQQGIMVAVYMGFAFFVDAQFAVLVSIGGALSNFLYRTLYKHTKGASRKLTFDSNIYQGQIIQHVANFKYLRATGLAEYFGDRLKSTITKIEASRRKIGMLFSVLKAAREPLLITVVAAVILVQVNLLTGTLGGVLISLLFFYRALAALTTLQNSWNGFLAVSGSMDNMKDFQEELKKAKSRIGKIQFNQLQEKLKLEKAFFAYEDSIILSDINFEISKNETIAFVGESGGGKTTLMNILAGLMPLDKGSYFIDAMDAKDLNIVTFQKRIGYITQEPVIFNDTIYNNVTLWAEKKERNIQRFYEVLKMASIADFVEILSDKEETELGNNGINLSGGQKQRISIARELYKDIDILIMDEATSALDSETEKLIQENIEALKGKYTILIVAHRLSTIKNADKIVFMNKGRIEAIGTYQDLLSMQSSFKRMVELQEL